MKLRKRDVFLIILALLPFYNLINFGDYCFGVVDLFIIGVEVVVFAIAFLAIFFNNLYLITLKKEFFDFRPVIIALLFGVTLLVGIKNRNIGVFKNKIFIFKSEISDKNQADIILYDNNTFEFKTRYTEYSCIKKGTYYFKNDSLFLKKHNHLEVEEVFDKIYYHNKTFKMLLPKNNSKPKFIQKR